MDFFAIGRKLQLLLIMGALAAVPGCYSSASGSDDVTEEDAGTDPGHEDPSVDVIDVHQELDVMQDSHEVGQDPVDEEFVFDTVPWPICMEVEASSLTVVQTGGRSPTYADGSVTLSLAPHHEINCSRPLPCISIAVGGSGAIVLLEQLSTTSATFRYENETMGYGEVATIDFTWQVTCIDPFGNLREDNVRAAAYACRDEMSGMLQIAGTYDECIPVVDPPPPPTALYKGGTGIAARSLAGGRIMLTLPEPTLDPQRVIWDASAGSLEVLAPFKALFTPSNTHKIQVVQAAVVTPRGVTIELYRHKG